MKKFTIILSALLFVLCLGFGGRSTYASQSNESFIKVQTISYQSGAVLQGFYFSCDDEMLALNGADSQTIQAFKNSLLSQINHLKSLMIASYSAIYLQNPNPEFAIGEGGGLEVSLVTDPSSNALGFQLLFTSQEAWAFYHPSDESETPAEESSQFITTHSSQGQIIFAQTLSSLNMTVGQYLKSLYLTAAQSVSLSVEESYNPSYIYEYALSSSKVHSNADKIEYSSLGLYHHIWTRSEDQLASNSQINLYYYQPNQEWWYLTAICIGLGVVLIGGVIAIASKKLKKEKTNQHKTLN